MKKTIKGENKSKFVATSLEEVEKPLWEKIAENNYMIRRFVFILSIVNIAAGFMFFYKPILNISENIILSIIISLIILIVIEIVGVLTFHYSILAINQKKKYGYILASMAVIILAFNIHNSAEGNKDLINKVAVKEIRLKKLLNDTINRTVREYNFEKNNIVNTYNQSLSQVEIDYKTMINDANNDIKISENGEKDWRKNNEATITKSKLIDKLNIERQRLLEYRLSQLSELKTNHEYTINNIKLTLNENIVDTELDNNKAAQVAYIFGIVLCLIIVTMRLIEVLSMIAAKNAIARKQRVFIEYVDDYVKDHKNTDSETDKKKAGPKLNLN